MYRKIYANTEEGLLIREIVCLPPAPCLLAFRAMFQCFNVLVFQCFNSMLACSLYNVSMLQCFNVSTLCLLALYIMFHQLVPIDLNNCRLHCSRACPGLVHMLAILSFHNFHNCDFYTNQETKQANLLPLWKLSQLYIILASKNKKGGL